MCQVYIYGLHCQRAPYSRNPPGGYRRPRPAGTREAALPSEEPHGHLPVQDAPWPQAQLRDDYRESLSGSFGTAAWPEGGLQPEPVAGEFIVRPLPAAGRVRGRRPASGNGFVPTGQREAHRRLPLVSRRLARCGRGTGCNPPYSPSPFSPSQTHATTASGQDTHDEWSRSRVPRRDAREGQTAPSLVRRPSGCGGWPARGGTGRADRGQS